MKNPTWRWLPGVLAATVSLSSVASEREVVPGVFFLPEHTWTHAASACALDESGSAHVASGAGISFAEAFINDGTEPMFVKRARVPRVVSAEDWAILEQLKSRHGAFYGILRKTVSAR